MVQPLSYANKLSVEGENVSIERNKWLEYLNSKEQKGTTEAELTKFNTEFIDKSKVDESKQALSLKMSSQNNEIKRYTVLLLDASGSTDGTPISMQKSAALKFCEAVLAANGENFVSVVSYDSDATMCCDFTDDIQILSNTISGIDAGGMTNTNASLETAEKLLSAIPSDINTIKNVLLLSDGLPNDGAYVDRDDPYTYDDYYYYQYANKVYDTAKMLKSNNYKLYTLGFFHSLYGAELEFARRFMNALQNAGYYDVSDPNDLKFVFGEIAQEM